MLTANTLLQGLTKWQTKHCTHWYKQMKKNRVYGTNNMLVRRCTDDVAPNITIHTHCTTHHHTHTHHRTSPYMHMKTHTHTPMSYKNTHAETTQTHLCTHTHEQPHYTAAMGRPPAPPCVEYSSSVTTAPSTSPSNAPILGSTTVPKKLSHAAAAPRPSAIAHTTSD